MKKTFWAISALVVAAGCLKTLLRLCKFMLFADNYIIPLS